MGETRGRKKGQKAGTAVKKVRAYWRPHHSAIVYMWASGHYTREELAKHFEKTPQTITNILATKEAEEILNKIHEEVRKKLTDAIPDKILELQGKAVERLAETMNEEFIPGSKAKIHQDRVGLGLLSKFVSPRSEEPSRDNSSRPSVSETLANRFISALEKSNEVALLQAKKEEAEIIEAEVLSIESPSKQRTA